jgi:hypothetical protein
MNRIIKTFTLLKSQVDIFVILLALGFFTAFACCAGDEVKGFPVSTVNLQSSPTAAPQTNEGALVAPAGPQVTPYPNNSIKPVFSSAPALPMFQPTRVSASTPEVSSAVSPSSNWLDAEGWISLLILVIALLIFAKTLRDHHTTGE